MFSLLIVFLLSSSVLMCSEEVKEQEKEFTFERTTKFIEDTAVINSIIRLRNNRTNDVYWEDRQYTLEKHQNELIVNPVLGLGKNSVTRSSEEVGALLQNQFPGIAAFYLLDNKKPNFSVSFDLNEIPLEQFIINENDFCNSYSVHHVVEFVNEHIASIRNQQRNANQNQPRNSKCLKLIEAIKRYIMQY